MEHVTSRQPSNSRVNRTEIIGYSIVQQIAVISMSDTDTNQHLLALLEVHRQRLRHLRQQAAVFDPGYVPSHVALELAGAYRDVAQVKGELRGSSIPVDDLPEDEAPQSPIASTTTGGKGRASRFTIQGPIQAGVINLGGLMNVDAPVQVSFGANASENQDDRAFGNSLSEPPGWAKISKLAGQLEAMLATAPVDRAPGATNVARRAQALIEASRASIPDRDFIAFQAESLRHAATPLGSALPDISALIEALISACSEIEPT
jgi:hypothetical protein